MGGEKKISSAIPDAAIELEGHIVYRADRTADSGKRKCGGVCIYVHRDWCKATDIIEKNCSEDLEYLMVKCRSLSMPRELTVITIMAVYIPPQANANVALEKLHTVVSKQQNVCPDVPVIVAGDFNHVNLKKILPKFNTNIFTPTRGKTVLDQVYTNI